MTTTGIGIVVSPLLSALKLALAQKIAEEVAKAPEAVKPALKTALIEKGREIIAEKEAALAVPRKLIIAGAAGLGVLALLAIILLAKKGRPGA